MIDINHVVIGFTGTRQGMSSAQKIKIKNFLLKLLNHDQNLVGEHGDCVGSDDEFDSICHELEIETFCRPCVLEKQRAFTRAKILSEPEQPINRNKKIVNDSSIIFATPSSEEEVIRSGTWSTIRYAQRLKKKLIIIYPSGKCSFHDSLDLHHKNNSTCGSNSSNTSAPTITT